MRSVLFQGVVIAGLSALVLPVAFSPAQAVGPQSGAPASTVVASAAVDVAATPVVVSQDLARVEVPGERTATSRTFLEPDGSHSSEVFSSPIHFRSGDGGWEPIVNTLVDSTRAGYVAENDANDYRLQIPADAGSAPVRFASDGRWLTFAARGADGAPRLEGALASIGGLGPDTRLEYEATGVGVKETVVLSAPPAGDPSYTFDLAASPGLAPRLSQAGGIDVVDEDGRVAFTVPAPFMVDSSGTDAGYSADVSFDVSDTARGWSVTMAADPAWLADPARVYPVSVDPSVTMPGADADCWVDQGVPAQNRCTGTSYLQVGASATGNARRAMLRFDVSGVPANATVTDADVNLYLEGTQSTSSLSAEYVARRMTRAWTGSATWNTYNGINAWTSPGGDYVTASAGGTLLSGTSSGYRAIAATSMVDAWVDGSAANHGMLVKQAYEATQNTLSFVSTDTGNQARWPKLTLTYTEPTVPVFDGAGDRRFYTYAEQTLNDATTAKVNVGNGNLLLNQSDLRVAGTGLDAGLERSYNSLAPVTGTDPARLGPGWVLGDAPTVRLEFPAATGRVIFVGPSGYRVRFDKNAAGDYVRAEPGLDGTLAFDAASNSYRLDWYSKARYVFNTSGQMTRSEDKQGNKISYTYTAAGDLDHLVDTRGRRIDFTYTAGLLDTVTDVAGGRVFDYDYARFAGDTTYRLASSTLTGYGLGTDTVNVGTSTGYDYDAAGRLTWLSDPAGHVTRVGYDGTSRRVETITRVTASATDPDPTTTFSYPAGTTECNDTAAVAVTKVDGPRTDVADVTTYCMDDQDRVLHVIDAKDHKRTTRYTVNSNVEKLNESDAGAGPSYGYGFDTADNPTSTTLPTSGQSTAAYGDATNPHLPTGVRDYATAAADPTTWAYDYDPNGNLLEASNTTTGVTFGYCYTGLGQLQRVDAPPVTTYDNSTSTGCGAADQDNDTLFSYDSNGNLTRVDPPGAHGTRDYTYDALSRVKTATDGRGVVTSYTYDARDRVTALDFTDPAGQVDGVADIGYTYDADGNLLARSDATGDTSFEFDELNRMTREAPQQHSERVDYTYDTAGNLTSLDASGEPAPVTYTYDNLNRATRLVDQRGRATGFSYNTRDMRTATTYPNGVTMRHVFDDSRRLSCVYAHTGAAPATGGDGCPTPATSLLTFFSYDYTAPGGRDTTTRYSETNRDGHTSAYTYDDLTRLTRARTTNGATEVRDYEYLLGARGNIARETVTGTTVTDTTTSYAYNDANELCATVHGTQSPGCGTPPAGATGYGYDDAGNLATTSIDGGPGLTAGYNLQGQTTQITPPGGAALTMAYADTTSDRRTEAGDQRFTYNQLGLGSQGQNSGTDQDTWFTRDPGGTLVSMVNADTNKDDLYYLFDGLGSVAATTDEQGNLVTRYTYEPYGQQLTPNPTLKDANGTPVDTNPWRYATGYYDTTTGTLKYGTRYYQPNIMRWTQPDPDAGNPANPANPMTLNPYAYVGCNPTNAVDASGRASITDLGLVGDAFQVYEALREGRTGDATAYAIGAVGGAGVEGTCHAASTITGPGAIAVAGACYAAGSAASYAISEIAKDSLSRYNYR